MKTFWVVNPQSANARTGKIWGEMHRAISEQHADFGHAMTRHSMEATDLTRNALKSGHDCIVAVGGDGTLNEVVNGFFENGKAIRPGAVLSVVPQGTGGDFRKSYGWDTQFSSALERIKTPNKRPLDVGLLEYTTHEGKTAQRYFINVCSFGIGGIVDREVNKSSKALGGKATFMIASLKAMLKYTDRNVRVSIDGEPEKNFKVTSFAVANGRYFGGGMLIAPKADTSDGLFDVTVWSEHGLVRSILKSRDVYNGSHIQWPNAQVFRAKSIRARSDEEVLIDCDGEQPGKLPCSMQILPGALQILA